MICVRHAARGRRATGSPAGDLRRESTAGRNTTGPIVLTSCDGICRRAGVAAAALLSLLVATGCDSTPSDPDDWTPAVQLLIVGGNNQSGPVDDELPEPMVVRAVDQHGRPLNHLVVSFVPTMGGGHAWAGAANTNPQGYAREYWTLGPEPGENRMEARVVDPATGDKLTLGIFVATAFEAVAPSPEVCDGKDNDQDGQTDEYLEYCFGGQPAPNTDGAVCAEGFVDLNADPTDGCETADLMDGHYVLDTPIEVECPGLPLGSMGLGAFDLTTIDASTVRVSIPISWSLFGNIYAIDAEAPFDESTLSLSGSGTYSVTASVYDVTAAGTFVYDLSQTSAGIIEGRISLATTVSGSLGGVPIGGTCTTIENQPVLARLQ